MKGYIYTMFKGADPGLGWHMTDPIFSHRPSLGACMPNIRRLVVPGDHIFVISGSAAGVQQYLVGGFAVEEKINALTAYERYPENRQLIMPNGNLSGNIIVNEIGQQNSFDYHSNFERRLENYIVGKNPLYLETPQEVALGRDRTLDVLRDVMGRNSGNSVKDLIGRWRKLSPTQINELNAALLDIKAEAQNARS